MTRPRRVESDRNVVRSLLQTAGLAGFAVTQPILDLLGRNPTFFVAHDSGRTEIVLLGLVAAVGVPVLLVTAESIVAFLRPGAFGAVHRVVVAILGCVVLFTALDGLVEPSRAIAALCAAAAVAVVALAHARVDALRTVLTWLAPAPLVFLVLFLGFSPSRTLVFPAGADTVRPAGEAAPVSVFFLVFDGLPLGHLMQGDGRIAADRFPNFRRLADLSTWYRNATTVHTHTHKSVPAILSGRIPDEGGSPTFDHYPQNLFTVLRPSHELAVDETITSLCPYDDCNGPPAAGEGFGNLLADSSLAYLHMLLPTSWSSGLPQVDTQWAEFRALAPSEASGGACDPDPAGITRDFDRWLEGARSAEPPTLHYLHLMVPHDPLRYLPTGQVYPGGPFPGFGKSASFWGPDQRLVDRGLQQFVLQVAYADTLVGRMLDHLEAEGLLRGAALVVTSDHGMGFTAGEARRRLSETIFEEAARVPLFVKSPDQLEGRVVDDNIESIDVLPTLADVLDLDLAEPVDGRSALDGAPRPTKAAAGGTPRREYPAALDTSFPVGVKMDRLFGRGGGQARLYSQGPQRDLVGRRLTELPTAAGGSRATVAQGRALEAFDPGADCLAIRLEGSIRSGWEGSVAVGLNGTVAAVADAYRDGDASSFIAMVPPDALRAGRNELSVFLVRGAGAGRTLERTSLAPGP